MLTIYKTADGSDTIYDDVRNNYFHSVHGALTESSHVFIDNGLKIISNNHSAIKIFELGFGTGLNAYLSYLFSEQHGYMHIRYSAIDKFPLPKALYSKLNYSSLLNIVNDQKQFIEFHDSPWNQAVPISEKFVLEKIKEDAVDWRAADVYDLIYMDAFSPNDQPELWTERILEKFYGMLTSGGLLTTYCSKGNFKRNLKNVGFRVECVPGPIGKREMTLAYK